jgi:uncharacterized protein YeeX (DUF496 family)
MHLSAEQIKVLIGMQSENYSKRIADLMPQIAALRSQPIEGSQELKRRLAYMERELSEQQARLAGLQDLQRAIQTAESFSSDEA